MCHNIVNLEAGVNLSQCLPVKARHLIRPVASRLSGMRPRISCDAIGPVNADGTANAEDRMTASSNDTVVWDAAEALVLDPLLLEIRRIVVIASDHHNPVVRLNKPTRDLCEDLLIISRPLEAKSAVSGNDEQSVRHSVLNAQLEHHFFKGTVDVSANHYAICRRVTICLYLFLHLIDSAALKLKTEPTNKLGKRS